MAARTHSMTEGRPLGLIVAFSLPLMLGNVFQQLYTVVDTMVVGQALGVGALAALGAADWLNWMVLGTIQGFTQGFSIKMSHEFGAGIYDRLRKTVANSILLAILSSVVLLLISQAAARPVLELLQTPDAIIGDSLTYLRIMFAGIPVVMAYNILAAILRALGDGKTPLYAMVVAALINVALDLIFVLVFHWGIAGAAGATVIAQVCSGIFCLVSILKLPVLAFSRSDFRMEGRLCLHLMKLGLPMAFQNAIISVGGMIVQFVVNGFGVLFIAGFTATNKLYGILEVAATSYGYAMVTYTGQNLGARKIERISKGMHAAILVAVVTSAVIAAAMLLFGKAILGLFVSGNPEEVAETLNIAYHYLAIMSVFLPVLYILHVTRSCLQGMGNTLLPMLSGIAEFIMRTGTAMLLPLFFGAEGIFYAEILAWLGADVILVASYIVQMRKLKRTA
ncbi:MAG TPA: MATE family efflux transporter [Candidatus Eisenbergiella pullistercoris]|uniref:MATE family efflux transporter n=1 Tax=Candidatus Eisenbergiella pullistercoris TaxID=2838555 RepID=A0A9D2C624_9FIRM|nr:MATE family efflux transporter [Candidatus Eisenbergiella pullistercoris]